MEPIRQASDASMDEADIALPTEEQLEAIRRGDGNAERLLDGLATEPVRFAIQTATQNPPATPCVT